VMITRAGTVKLLDFGIARRIEGAQDDGSAPTDAALGTLTEEGGLVGSVAYMSPEQIAAHPLDGRADQFAWAVMAHQVLTGKPVWTTTSSMFSMAAAILHEEPTVDEKLAGSIACVLKKCLSKSRDDRYPTMTEALSAFEAAVANNEPKAASDTDVNGASDTQKSPISAPTSAPIETGDASAQSSVQSSAQTKRGIPVGLLLVGAAIVIGVGFLVVRRDLPSVPPPGSVHSSTILITSSVASSSASPMTSANASGSSSAAAPSEPLMVKCKPEIKLDCGTADDVRWCIDPDKPLVCCSKGLVGTPAGRCACPDGGTKQKTAIEQGCKEADPHYADSLHTTIRSHLGEIKSCYEKALAKNPKLSGKMTLSFEITNHGKLAGAHLGGTSMPDVDFQDCSLAALQNVVFEPPPEGFVNVGYPLEFAPGDPKP
jgi:hypothetical protein